MVFNPNPGSLVLLVVAAALLWLVAVLWEDAMHKARTGRNRWEE